MKISSWLFFALFFSLYGAVNFYIGLRGWQAFSLWLAPVKKFYWATLFFLASAFFLARTNREYLPEFLYTGLNLSGAYWIAAVYYFFLLLAVIDAGRLILRWAGRATVPVRPELWGTAVILVIAVLLAYGTWNARHPVVRHYDITIDKSDGNHPEIHAVMVSDIHLGPIINYSRLSFLIDSINQLNPDIVFFTGDMIDGSIGPFIEQNMASAFVRLHPSLGTYAVFGNHEYISGEEADALTQLQTANIAVLRDEAVLVADSFYIVGRDDRSRDRYTGTPRRSLSDIMTAIDRSRPVILLDHQPFDLHEAQEQGADLQLSGHTHHGQFFPNQLVTENIYEIDWGYLKKDSYQIIVSCGYGTWGPPIRIGNTPEIIDIAIRFAPSRPIAATNASPSPTPPDFIRK